MPLAQFLSALLDTYGYMCERLQDNREMLTDVVILQLSLGSEEDLAADLSLTSFHLESERPPSSEETPPIPAGMEEQQETQERPDGEEEEEISNRYFTKNGRSTPE